MWTKHFHFDTIGIDHQERHRLANKVIAFYCISEPNRSWGSGVEGEMGFVHLRGCTALSVLRPTCLFLVADSICHIRRYSYKANFYNCAKWRRHLSLSNNWLILSVWFAFRVPRLDQGFWVWRWLWTKFGGSAPLRLQRNILLPSSGSKHKPDMQRGRSIKHSDRLRP